MTRAALASSEDAGDSFEKLIKQLVKQPRREPVLQVYQKVYWDSRLKSHYELEFARRVDEAARKGTNMPRQGDIDIKTKVASARWALEGQAFKDSVEELAEKRHRDALEDYNRRYIATPETAEDKEW